MVKNTKGGSRHKKAKNYTGQTEKIVMCDENADEHYAYVSRAYGNGQFGVHLVQSDIEGTLTLTVKEYRGRISGRMRKRKFRNFVRANDLVLIAKRDFQTNDEKVDIIHVYKHDVVKKLAKMGHVPMIDNLQDSTNDAIQNTIVFSHEDDDEHIQEMPSTDVSSTQKTNTTEWEIDVEDI